MPIGDVIRANAANPLIRHRPLILFENLRVSHAEYYRESQRFARLFLRLRPSRSAPFHIGILMDNLPEFLYALGGAALVGAVVVGINHTRRGEHLARDIEHADCALLFTESKYVPLLEPIRDHLSSIPDEQILVNRRWDRQQASLNLGMDLETALPTLGEDAGHDPGIPVDDRQIAILIFTSGTTAAPKAVMCSHQRMMGSGARIAELVEFTDADVGYIAMPLFHSNALMCGFLPALIKGGAVALIRKFSKSQFLSDVRRYGVTYFNYTGKPLSYILTTPRQPDDHINPLRVAYGNEGSWAVVQEFSQRFGCRVIEAFGATEGGLGWTRTSDDPPASVGKPGAEIKIFNDREEECPPARFDQWGRLLNAEEAIGEIVNTAGIGYFEGYYKNEEATRQRTRGGRYWSGDLGYQDEAGYLYFAGRDVDWIRVEGENFPAKPIEDILARFPGLFLCAVYGVPDHHAGDQVMATVVMEEHKEFVSQDFYRFLAAQRDLSPKWVPTYVRVTKEMPQTPSNKILKQRLRREKFRLDLVGDPLYWREKNEEGYRAFTTADYQMMKELFSSAGREHLLEL